MLRISGFPDLSRLGQIRTRVDIVWRDANGFSERRDCLIDAAELGQDDTELVVDNGPIRLVLQRLTIRRDGVLAAACGIQRPSRDLPYAPARRRREPDRF